MNEFFVVEIAGRQYLVNKGQELLVDKINAKDNFVCEKILLVSDKSGLKVGAPYVEKQRVEFEVLGDVKMPKVRVATFHAKANYRRVKGMRAVKSKLRLK